MTTLADAVANLNSTIAAVQIGGTNLFHPSSVYATTNQPDEAPEGALEARVRWTPLNPGLGHPGQVQIHEVEVEVLVNQDAGSHGTDIIRDSFGENGLASIRSAIVDATEYIDGSSTYPVAAYIRYDRDGRPPDSSGGNQHLFSLIYEAVIG